MQVKKMGLDVFMLLIPASFLMALIALGVFLWANHNGQFDDLQTPAIRILLDDGSSSEPVSQPATPQTSLKDPA